MAFTIGQAVKHPSFGTGTVISVEGDKIGVRFDNPTHGEKKIMAQAIETSDHTPKPVTLPKKTKAPKVEILPDTPFQEYLKEVGCSISAEVPANKWQAFVSRYHDATGDRVSENTPGILVQKVVQSWGFSMSVTFPKPPRESSLELPSNARVDKLRPNALVIYDNDFIWALFANGFSVGRNEPDTSQADLERHRASYFHNFRW